MFALGLPVFDLFSKLAQHAHDSRIVVFGQSLAFQFWPALDRAENLRNEALCMISISVKNVVAFLQLVNGFSHEEVQVALPAKKEAFELFSRPSEGLGLAYLGFNLHIPENAAGLTKQQILDRLNEIKAKQK